MTEGLLNLMTLGLVSCPHIHREGGNFFKFADSENTKSMFTDWTFTIVQVIKKPHDPDFDRNEN